MRRKFVPVLILAVLLLCLPRFAMAYYIPAGNDTHINVFDPMGAGKLEACSYGTMSTRPPTCETAGSEQLMCVNCFNIKTIIIRPIQHDWGKWASDNRGSHVRTCKNDASHQEKEACVYRVTTTRPTCQSAGEKISVCTGCGYRIRETLPKAAHLPGAWMTIRTATDLRTGKQEQKCQVCKELLSSRVLSMQTQLSGRTATLRGEFFPDEKEGFRIHYMYLPLTLSEDNTKEVAVIASNRYVIGTLKVTVKGGEMMLSFTPLNSSVIVSEPYLALFTSPEQFEKQDLDTLTEQNLPLDTWLPLPGKESGEESKLFLRFKVDFNNRGMETVTL